MRKLLLSIGLLGVACLPALANVYHLSPDVPTDDPAGSGTVFLPWDIVWNDGSGSYNLTASLPMWTPVDALHRMCTGDWLFSVEAPTELPPGSGANYLPGDVIRWNGVNYSLFFDSRANGVPTSANVDAAFLNGGDSAPLVLSFDVPTTLGATTYDPADLVRYQGAGAYVIFFDASAATPPVAATENVTAADHRLTTTTNFPTILSFDVPSAFGVPDFLPGESVAWNGVAASSFFLDPNWAITSRLDALALPPDPGRVPQYLPPSLLVIKAISFPPKLDLSWSLSSSVGANDYALYEGNLQTLRTVGYTHGSIACSTGGALNRTITPGPNDHYFLVVPLNFYDEGSYGQARFLPGPTFPERPQGIGPCRPTQALGCP